uniref:Uncharacterized protein n=1 Tax=Oryza sativa subsp. japonica TaxID=39947 RepID=Q69TQ7_ORYSJ|nr:hypothetical protein [Oryza sativa Japonica Group]BAD35770.1 hypothetical protein [Oryza sativa Japonica Group]
MSIQILFLFPSWRRRHHAEFADRKASANYEDRRVIQWSSPPAAAIICWPKAN